jgi:hypothetical protein
VAFGHFRCGLSRRANPGGRAPWNPHAPGTGPIESFLVAAGTGRNYERVSSVRRPPFGGFTGGPQCQPGRRILLGGLRPPSPLALSACPGGRAPGTPTHPVPVLLRAFWSRPVQEATMSLSRLFGGRRSAASPVACSISPGTRQPALLGAAWRLGQACSTGPEGDPRNPVPGTPGGGIAVGYWVPVPTRHLCCWSAGPAVFGLALARLRRATRRTRNCILKHNI